MEYQSIRLGSSLDDEVFPEPPLIGTVAEPSQFVTKESMIAAMRQDVQSLKEAGVVDASVEEHSFSGHSLRRAGVKYLARLGTPLDLIMHLSRHSSSAVHGYVEEAFEESPIEQRKFVAFTTLQKQINDLAGQRHSCNDILTKLIQEVASQARTMGQRVDRATVERIARDVLHPEVVMNLETRKLHSTNGCSFVDSPLRWATRCGWKWVGADTPIKFISSTDGLPSQFSACDKCMPYFPNWVNSEQ